MDLSDGFRIGDWRVLPREGRILSVGDGEFRRVRPKAMDVLRVLAAHSGQVVERDDLLSEVWGRTAVTDEPLTATIGELRRLLGERQGEDRRYIETIPKRGYRLLAEVIPLPDAPADSDAAPAGANPSAAQAAAADMRAADVAATTRASESTPSTRRAPSMTLDWKAFLAIALALAVAAFAFQHFTRPGQTPVPERSIAVLPFEDLSPNRNQDYFADGLAEELISLLTSLPSLKVAARNSAFSFRGQTLGTDEIAARLKVAHVLTGSVQRMGDQVRVTAQLVDARAGYQLWSETYDRTLDDIFAIQDEIAGQVTRELRLQLLGGAFKVRETDARAYSLYLQARHIGRQHTRESLERAVELYRQALAIDPEYLPAWNELAGVYFNLVGYVLIPQDQGYGLAREAASRALAIDPDYAPAHDRLGWLALYEDNDLTAAAEHYRQALSLEPANFAIRSNAALLALALGRLDEAIALFEDSVARDPVAPASHANLANAYLLDRRYPEAELSIRNTLMLSPQYAGAHYRLGRILLARGDFDAAREAIQTEPLEAGGLLGRAMLANVEDRPDDSQAALAELHALYGDQAAGNIAGVYAHRGDIDAAFEWLDTEYRSNGAAGFLEYRWDPLFDPLRGDPRWAALLERIGFGAAEVAAIEFPSIAQLNATTEKYRKN